MLPVRQIERKRQRTESPDQVHDLPVKKQRRSEYPDHWIPSEQFWNTLPKIYLTRRALSEHNQRNRHQTAPIFRRQSARLRSAHTNQIRIPLSGPTTRPSVELKRFARRGGPDLTSIRNFPDTTMSDQTSRPSRRTTSSGLTTSSKRSGPYDANYQLKLEQAGIFLTEQTDANDDVVLPTNYDEITARLMDSRQSLSPSRFTEKDFQRFRRQAEKEILESETMQNSMSIIEGAGIGIYSRMGAPFNNIEPFDPELAMAVPDSYDGAPPLSFDHRVLNNLNEHIVPNTDTTRPAAPNFFLEGKSRKGRADVAKRQAAHTGAIGARGMISLQSYQSPTPTYDNNAYSFTNTYHDGQLKMYTSHATAPDTEGGPPQYHMTPLKAFAMTGDSDTFRKGATHYRNARDLAKEQRDSLIQQANRIAEQTPRAKRSIRSHSTTNTLSMRTNSHTEEQESSEDTDTSPDELALDKDFKRSRNETLYHDEDENEEDDAVYMSFTTSMSSYDHDIPAMRISLPASRDTPPKRVQRAMIPASHDPNRTTLTISSTHSPTIGQIKAASQTKQNQLKGVSLGLEPERLSSRKSSTLDKTHGKHRQSSKQTAAPDLIEVHTTRKQQDGITGREFISRRRRVFIPDEEWQEATRSNRTAWVNWERKVYCFDS